MTIINYKYGWIGDNPGMNCLREPILSLDTRMPRYTSYPTAPHFKLLDDTQEYTRKLDHLESGQDISLYIHIPFCSKLCWYCGCHTKITKRYAPVEDYAHLLLREIDLLAENLKPSQVVTNVHFGGGSPGLLRACDFDMLLSKLRSKLNIADHASISIELDPRGITEGRVKTYAKNGVNRVSLGVQDFDENVLEAVNRQQPFSLSYNAVKLLREYGIDKINVDVMYGLPHQTLETQAHTLEKLISLEPARIAFFGYAHVPWMKKHMRLIDENALPKKDLRFDLFESGQKFLKENGYMSIGIDHFAKAEDSLIKALENKTLRRNFQGYVDDQADILIGLGVSSIGKIEDRYFQNYADMSSYKAAVLSNSLPIAKSCSITKEDQMRAKIIEQLMCFLSVDLKDVCKKYNLGVSYFSNELEKLENYERLGFIKVDNHIVTVNPSAKLATRMICSVFDSYMNCQKEDKSPKHATAI